MSRTILGLGAVFLVAMLTNLGNPATTKIIGDYSTFKLWWTLEESGKMLVAWFIGGLVAQRSFALPAAVFSLLMSAGTIWLMSAIVPSASVLTLIQENVFHFAVGVVVAVAGALLGERFSSSPTKPAAN